MSKAAANNSHDEPADKLLKIRKYPNRRYYDTTRSRHLTLEELYAAVRDGYEIEVIDSKSGEDITAKVLAQIIIDLDPPKLGVFPVPLLHRLLRANEQLVQDFTKKYFNQALDAFLDSQRKFEQSMRSALGLPAAVPTVSDLTRMMWGPFSPAAPAGPDAGTPPRGAAEPDLKPVVSDLRRQVEELEKQLKQRPARAPAAAAAKKKQSRRR